MFYLDAEVPHLNKTIARAAGVPTAYKEENGAPVNEIWARAYHSYGAAVALVYLAGRRYTHLRRMSTKSHFVSALCIVLAQIPAGKTGLRKTRAGKDGQ